MAPKCQRPCWTVIFVGIWLLVIPATLLTHASVGILIPSIGDLPVNLASGFDEVFKFAYMLKDAEDIKVQASGILSQCQVPTPATTCADSTLFPDVTTSAQLTTVDTTSRKAAIVADFENSLGTVKMVAEDKYLGTPDLNETAKNLATMTVKIAEINPSMPCFVAVPVFCGLWTSGNGIVEGMAVVDKAINAFKTSDIITQWDNNKGVLVFLHALPYFMVLGMLIFSLFWYKGGVCCCCREGTKTGLLLPIYAILWLLSFIIYLIVFAVGFAIKYGADRINVSVLNGNPTLEEAIAHIQLKFPGFWAIVFADLETGLALLFDSSFFFLIAALLIMLYSLLMCCCCPYREKNDQA